MHYYPHVRCSSQFINALSAGENGQGPCVEDGFSQSEVDAAKQLIDLMDPAAVKAIRCPDVPTVDKLILASKLSGLKWESNFWEVARASFSSTLEDCLDPRLASKMSIYDSGCHKTIYFKWFQV